MSTWQLNFPPHAAGVPTVFGVLTCDDLDQVSICQLNKAPSIMA